VLHDDSWYGGSAGGVRDQDASTFRGSRRSGTVTTCRSLSADDLTSEMLTESSVIAVPVVAEKRLTFPRTNVFAEVPRERSIEPVRFSARPDGHA